VIARYPGTCVCCAAPFHAGAQVERRGSGWVRASCLNRPATASGAQPSSQLAVVLEILDLARKVAARAEAEARARFAGSTL
jgi:hypothetical protein